MSTNKHEQQRYSAPVQKVEQAMLRTGAARQEYIKHRQHGEPPEGVLKQFHISLINYWMELRPYRNNGNVDKQWEEAELWERPNGETVTGLDHLREWVSRMQPGQSKSAGRGTSKQADARPARLPEEALVDISLVLDDIAHELGFSAQTKGAGKELFAVKRDPEDYPEPVNDEIPAPQ